jgi:hypothetical protein
MKELLSATTEDGLYGEKIAFDKMQDMLEQRFEELYQGIQSDLRSNGVFDLLPAESWRDYFFDYMYNCDEMLSFDEYMAKYSKVFD